MDTEYTECETADDYEDRREHCEIERLDDLLTAAEQRAEKAERERDEARANEAHAVKFERAAIQREEKLRARTHEIQERADKAQADLRRRIEELEIEVHAYEAHVKAGREMWEEETGNGFIKLSQIGAAKLGRLVAAASERDELRSLNEQLCDQLAQSTTELVVLSERLALFEKAEHRGLELWRSRNPDANHMPDMSDTFCAMADQLSGAQEQRDEARHLVLDLFAQACAVDGKYDHMCVSTYEDAQAALIEWGFVKPEECVNRDWKDKR